MSQYEEYNDMLNHLYSQHTSIYQLHIKIESVKPLSEIQRKAVNHFVSKLRVQEWIVYLTEYIEAMNDAHEVWEDKIYYLIIEGNHRSKL